MAGRIPHEQVRVKRLLFDNSVVLDVLLERQPWVEDAGLLLEMRDAGQIEAHVSAITIPNTFYIVRRVTDLRVARTTVQRCFDVFQIIPVDVAILRDADAMPGADYEDNVQIACAVAANLDAIVTRDPADFVGAPIPVWSPAEALRQLTA